VRSVVPLPPPRITLPGQDGERISMPSETKGSLLVKKHCIELFSGRSFINNLIIDGEFSYSPNRFYVGEKNKRKVFQAKVIITDEIVCDFEIEGAGLDRQTCLGFVEIAGLDQEVSGAFIKVNVTHIDRFLDLSFEKLNFEFYPAREEEAGRMFEPRAGDQYLISKFSAITTETVLERI
jgi:hypothetical protein